VVIAVSKVPLQIHLDRSLRERLKAVAHKQNLSMSALVRKYLYQGLERELGPDDPALDIIGIGSGTKTDLAEQHDRYLVLNEKGIDE